jgi:ATP-dependent RNA helicase DeaD
LWIGLGKNDGLDEAGLKAALDSVGAPAAKMVASSLLGTFSYAIVHEGDVAAFEAGSGKEFKGRRLKIERARDPNAPRAPREDAPGPRIWVNLGRNDKLDDAGLAKALEELGAPSGKILKSMVRDSYGYVFVADADVPSFLALSEKKRNDKTVVLEVAANDPAERRERHRQRTIAAGGTPEPESVRLWVNLVKSDGLDEQTVISALESQGAPGGKVKQVQLRDTYAYAFVSEEDVGGFEALTGKSHGDKALKVERSRRR